MNKKLLLRLFVLVVAILCALGAKAAEAYANYTPLNTTLTFYYDNLRSTRSGTTYDLNTGTNSPGWKTDGTNANVTKVVFNSSFANVLPTSTDFWFYGMRSLQSITGISYLNTTEVTSMYAMFVNCSSLTSLDLSSFNTANVKNMGNMFAGCSSLGNISVGNGWSTASVANSGWMFSNCTNLIGGLGTKYDSAHIDKDYAHIDGGSCNPGYFIAEGSGPWDGTEVYACYTPSNTTLTFYCDKLRSTRSGTTYDLNTGTNSPGWKTDGTNANVTKVVFNSSFANVLPTSTVYWFYGMRSLQSITGISYLNTSIVTDMSLMFSDCSGLTTLDLSNFNTANVTNMWRMFYDCSSLTSLDLSNFNTAKVTNMQSMFYDCSSLTTLDLSSFNTSNVTDMKYMFLGCSGLTSLNLRSFNTAKVSSMWSMFYNCSSLTSLDLSSFNTAKVTNMSFMFLECSELTSLDLSNFNTANVESMREMFSGCTALTSLDLSNFNTANVESMREMFSGCTALTSLDLSNFNTAEVTNMQSMFEHCSSLTTLDLSSFDTERVIVMEHMFNGCNSLSTINAGVDWTTDGVSSSDDMFTDCFSLVGGKGTIYDANHVDKAYAHIDGGTANPGYLTGPGEAYACYTPSNTTLTFYFDDLRSTRQGTTYDLNEPGDVCDTGWYNDGSSSDVTTVVFDPSFADAHPRGTTSWFQDMGNLTSIIGMEYLNTSKVTDMSWMFSLCWGMETFDLSHFDTRKVTNMSYMFNYCEGMTSIDLSNFDTRNVLDMEGMFYECSSLTSLDLSSFNTENVHNFKEMFYDCASLTSMDLRHFDTRNAETMNGMFSDCSGLTRVNLSSFNTQHVDNMNYMFGGCSSLTSLELSSFDTDYLTNTIRMFDNCRSLKTVFVGGNWDASNVENSDFMFNNCTSIVGGMGTTYDDHHVDVAYAHIDGGPSDPGYFSAMVKYNPVMLPADEQYIDLTSFRADWTDETPANYVDNYTLEVNLKLDEAVFLDRLDGSIWDDYNYQDIEFSEPWGGVNTRVGKEIIYFKNNYNGNATGCLTFTIPDGYTNATFSLVITSGSTEYGAGNFTVYTPQTPAVGHNFVAGETYTWMVTASSGEKITVYTTDEEYSPDIALIEVYFTGYAGQLITGITDKFCTVENLEAGGTYCYRVKTHYINETESEWSNIEEVTLSESTHFLRGDVNGDGTVNIADVTALIDYLLSGNASGINVTAADCNQDSSVNISDVTALIDYLLSGTW